MMTEAKRNNTSALNEKPNIIVILADDLGYSDIGCYGGEIDTPWLDRLARVGIRLTQFYTTPRCSPSRASLLTGLHPHQVGIGILNNDQRPYGYRGSLSEECVTLAECLKSDGYVTYMCGKWHLASNTKTPNNAWPTRRGFDHYYGSLQGGNYFRPTTLMRDEQDISEERDEEGFFYTDALSNEATNFIDSHRDLCGSIPFFIYLSYTAPHWPLHAHKEDIAKYSGRFDEGWDRLREKRLERLISEGVLRTDCTLSESDTEVVPWDAVEDKAWETRRMEVYAAQVDRMDRGIGLVLESLIRNDYVDDTIVVFLSDNGGCAEELAAASTGELPVSLSLRNTRNGEPVKFGNQPNVMPGPESTFQSYGRGWANLSNTPFREYKHWVHEGGISTPFIFSWPSKFSTQASMSDYAAHVTDIVPTLLEAAGLEYPNERNGVALPHPEGKSILNELIRYQQGAAAEKRKLFWEHEGNCSVREGAWKLVKKYGGKWELYDIESDRAESVDLAGHQQCLVERLAEEFEEWAARCDVIPYKKIALESFRG